MDLAAVAMELYALPPADFTAARNEQAKAARAAGEQLVAKRIGRLPKPSAAAWAVNQLARHRTDQVDRVLELGASLRRAQQELDSDAMRRLGPERQRLLTAVVREGRALAWEAGVGVSDAAAADMEQTLQAGMADADAAAAVRSGRLVRTLSSNGIDPVDLTDAVAAPEAPTPPAASGSAAARGGEPEPDAGRRRRNEAEREREREQRARDRERAEADAAEAEQALRDAEAELAEAEGSVATVSAHRQDVAERLGELRKAISALEEELASVEREAGHAERARKLAERLVEQERRSARLAQERLDRLSVP